MYISLSEAVSWLYYQNFQNFKLDLRFFYFNHMGQPQNRPMGTGSKKEGEGAKNFEINISWGMK